MAGCTAEDLTEEALRRSLQLWVKYCCFW